MKVLITGFTPFGDLKINPSEVLVTALKSQKWKFHVDTLVLETSFKSAREKLESYFSNEKPDFAIHFGVSEKSQEIALEKLAINHMYCINPDNESVSYSSPCPIDKAAPAAIMSSVEVEKLAKKMSINHSYSAGTFVCNYIYFLSMQEMNKRNKTSIFIHIPSTTDMSVEGKYSALTLLDKSRSLIEELISEVKF